MYKGLLTALLLALFAPFFLDAGEKPRQGDGDSPALTPRRTDVKPFAYVEAKLPFYPPGRDSGKQQKPITQMQLPLDPDESMKHMVTPADLEVRLFAAEPDIKRPICMNWDERGRLWIAETVDYPNELRPAGQGRDRIVICTDTDGDGRADKFTVFADRLSIPTGFTFSRGGIIVVQAPDTLFLRDVDGDDVADERTILFTGWGTGDTHAGPNNLRYGFDNWIYGMCGYSGFEGTVGGVKHSFRQGFFRFRPDGNQLEFLRSTNNNSWGLGFSEEGLLFGSTANGNPSVYLPIPNRYYEKVRGWSAPALTGIAGNAPMAPITDKVRQVDWHGHFTAAAGHALYTARTFPRTYWNRAAFVCEPTGHLIATFLLEPEGADFRSRNAFNLLASDDEWTAPVAAEVGPDGCVWVIDWYNYIVQHNPTPAGFKNGKGNAYETPLRDKTHGRIYRIVPRGYKEKPAFCLDPKDDGKLTVALRNDNLFWRLQAQRLLIEGNHSKWAASLTGDVMDREVDEVGVCGSSVHALWTLHGFGSLGGVAGVEPSWGCIRHAYLALRNRSAAARRNAALVLPHSADSARAILDARLLEDRVPHVRLAALLALSEMPEDERVATALTAALRTGAVYDKVVRDGLTIAAAAHARPFLIEFLQVAARLEPGAEEVVARVAEHYARGGPADSIGSVLLAVAESEGPATPFVLAGLARGWPRGTSATLAEPVKQGLVRRFEELPLQGRVDLVRLGRRLGGDPFAKQAAVLADSLFDRIADEKLSDDDRIRDAAQAADLLPEDPRLGRRLLDAITPRSSPQLTAGLLESLVRAHSPGVGSLLVDRLSTLSPQGRAVALRVLLARPETTPALLDAAEKNAASLDDLTLTQKQALLAHPDPRLAAQARKLFARGGGLPSPDRQKVLDELLPLTRKSGDVAQGKLVFKKHCATCHMHGGEGAKIGPDLTGVAAHTREHLLTDILDPSRSVEGNFRVYSVTTTDGLVFSGLLASESKTAIELVDAQAKKQVIQRDSIDQLVATKKSLMPEGFEKQLAAADFVNLLEFLTQRGKYMPLPLDKVATIDSTHGMFTAKDASEQRLIFPDWSPRAFKGVPFQLVDPQGGDVPNAVLLYGPVGEFPPKMPRSVRLPYTGAARAVHLLSGVSGWGYPGGKKGALTMTVRIHYVDGATEDHALRNGEHFADYIHRIDVPGSEFAFPLRDQQIRYLAVPVERSDAIQAIELVKGTDGSAPVVMAVTVESRP